MASLALTDPELKESILAVMQLHRTYSQLSAQEQSDVNRIIRAGRRRFFAYPWQFLVREHIIHVEAPVTGYVANITNGAVSLTSGTWPVNPTGYWIKPTSGDLTGLFEIASFSVPIAQLADTSVTEAGVGFTLYRTRYDLPSIFSSFESPVTIENSEREVRQVGTVPDYETKSLMSDKTNIIERMPELISVFQTQNDETGIPVWHLDIWPLSDKAYTLTSRIRIYPGDSLAEIGAISHPIFSECLLEMTLAAAESYYNDEQGVHAAQAAQLLQTALEADRRAKGVRFLRDNQRRDQPWFSLFTPTDLSSFE